MLVNQEYGGERPLYKSDDLWLRNVTIHAGESSLKESRKIEAEHCRFEGKYVFWENEELRCIDSIFTESARSSIWYSRKINLFNCRIEAPKFFRRVSGLVLEDVVMTDAQESFWNCDNIKIDSGSIKKGNYLFLNCRSVDIENCMIDGNFAFQTARQVTIRDSVIVSKDSFWESEDCTLVNCEIDGEYLGWYSKRLRLVDCRIKGTQPLCYCENLVLENCTFDEDADLAFEYSTVNATIRGKVTSIKNPTSGIIVADEVGGIVLDENQRQPADCKIEIRE